MNAEKSNFNSYSYILILDFVYALFINFSFKCLCESSETIHTKYFELLETEMLLKCPLNTQSTQRLVTYATEIIQRKH